MLWTAPAADVLSKLIFKLRYLTHIGTEGSFAALRPIQLAFPLVAVALWRHRLRVVPGHQWLLAAPLAALGVHVFYVVDFYYPRHIVFGYLLAGLVTLVMLAEDGLLRGRSVR